MAFQSRKLQIPMRSFNSYDKKMLAIMNSLAKFRKHLVGNLFCIMTYHNNMKHFLGQQDLNERRKKRVSKI